jgi:PilZ domain
MQENTSHTPRRWGRQSATVQISLVSEADPSKADDSAITVDISPRGASVQTKLALVPGEWLKVAAIGEISHAVAAHVAWVREDESSHSSFAGLEFQNTPATSNGPEMNGAGISGDLTEASTETDVSSCCPQCGDTYYRATPRWWYERLMKRPKMARCFNCHHRFPYPTKRN